MTGSSVAQCWRSFLSRSQRRRGQSFDGCHSARRCQFGAPRCWRLCIPQPTIRSQATSGSLSEGAVQQTRELRRIPRVTYSSDWKAVNIVELEQLLEVAQPTRRANADGEAEHSGLSFQRQFGILPGSLDSDRPDERRRKLALMLTRSMCFVAAYVRADSMPGFVSDPEPEGEEENWAWVVEHRRRGRRKQLVGFARASGDCELVSTLYDVVVHPDLQGLGIGKRLIRRICQSVFSLGIGDVAVMAPQHLHHFFEACSFGPDQVCDSSLMAYLVDPAQTEIDGSVHLKRNSLEAMMKAKLRHG